jgi:hypothetical protein
MKSLVKIFFAAVNLLYAAMFGGPIDGTAWDVKVKKEGFFHWISTRDTLVFHDGRAVVAGEVARGYTSAIYDAKEDSTGTVFSIVLAGDDRDPVEWSGRVEGGRINGVVIVRARDGHVARYVFTGERKTG